MHVGHLRATVIGDALCRMLAHLGHHVIRQNHMGDWGTPFGMLIEHLVDLGEEKGAHELSVGDLNTFYQQARAAFDADPRLQERSRAGWCCCSRGTPRPCGCGGCWWPRACATSTRSTPSWASS